MSEKSKIRAKQRQEKADKEARNVVNGIFFGLIAVMVIALILYFALAS
ncbi:MAG: hypothetical protein PUH21_00690 [Prevotellaceae bacterium]|jgi:hypothetical protein|nr:hypothetical protein [Prevotellaceae bacterium]MDY3856837.1 hypothetical protein [Bacteroidaceae bacterium]